MLRFCACVRDLRNLETVNHFVVYDMLNSWTDATDSSTLRGRGQPPSVPKSLNTCL